VRLPAARTEARGRRQPARTAVPGLGCLVRDPYRWTA
jgi:hypothetical protein